MSGKKPFKPLEEDLDDVADRVAAAKNIPTLTPPARAREEGAPAPHPPQQAPEPLPAPRASAPAAARRNAPPPEPARQTRPVTQIRFRCPNHVSDQLVFEQQRLRREGQRVTLNYLILSALRKAGYRVEEGDLIEDGRRLR